eukprot:42993-Hanusia_phi.AAC.1
MDTEVLVASLDGQDAGAVEQDVGLAELPGVPEEAGDNDAGLDHSRRLVREQVRKRRDTEAAGNSRTTEARNPTNNDVVLPLQGLQGIERGTSLTSPSLRRVLAQRPAQPWSPCAAPAWTGPEPCARWKGCIVSRRQGGGPSEQTTGDSSRYNPRSHAGPSRCASRPHSTLSPSPAGWT